MNNYEVSAIVTERNQLVAEARGILDRADREHRDLDAAETRSVDRIFDRVDDLRAQETAALAERRRYREADEARAAWEPMISAADAARRNRASAGDVLDFLRGHTRSLTLDLGPAWREKRLLRAGADARDLRREYRDLVEDTTTAGGHTVPTSFQRQLVDYLEWYTGARQLNVTVLSTASGEPLAVPKVTSHGTAVLRGEGTALAENDAAFGQTTLGAWKYGTLVQVSNELLADTGVDMLDFIARDTARAIARVTDTDYVLGNGSSKPQGIMTTMPVGATAQTASTGVPGVDNLLDLLYSVNPTARAEGAYWFSSDVNYRQLRKLKDTTGRPLWEPSLIAGEPDTLLGYPTVQDPNITAWGTAGGTHLAFGNFSGYFIRDAGPMRFERSDDFAFSSDLVTFRAIMRTDADWIDQTTGVRFMKAPTS